MYLVCIICGMNSKEIIRRLLQEGWVRDGGQGSHQRFVHPDRPGHVTVPHPRKDFPYGTLKAIFAQAGWGKPPTKEGENHVIPRIC